MMKLQSLKKIINVIDFENCSMIVHSCVNQSKVEGSNLCPVRKLSTKDSLYPCINALCPDNCCQCKTWGNTNHNFRSA